MKLINSKNKHIFIPSKNARETTNNGWYGRIMKGNTHLIN